MCNHDDSSHWWLLFLFALLVLFSVRTVSGQEPSALLPTPSLQSQEPIPSSGLQDSNTAWQLLMQDWYGFMPIWETLTEASRELGIGISELPAALKSTRESLVLLSASYQADIVVRLRAEQSRNAWRTGALVSGGLALILGGIVAVGIIF